MMKTYNVQIIKQLAVFIIFLLNCVVSSHSETKPKLEILVEDLGNEAIQCGVSKQTILTPAILTLRNNGIIYSTQNTTPRLYMNVNIMKNNNICVFGVNAEIYYVQSPTYQNGIKAMSFENVQLCSSHIIGMAGLNAVDNQINIAIENSIKNCLAKIQY